MEKKSLFTRSLESFRRFSKTTAAKSFFLVLACLLTVAILILSVCTTGHKEKMDNTVSLEAPLDLPEDDYSFRSRLYSADEYWSALDSEKTADVFLSLPDTIDDAPETDDRIRIVRESPSSSTDFVSVTTDTIIIVVLVFGGVSLFLLVLAIVVCLMGLLVKAVAWLVCCVKGAFSDNPKKNAGISAGTDGETLEFLEFDLAERMSGIGRPARGRLPKFRNESLPWDEAVQHVFDIPEWKGLYRIRFVFDNDDDADFEPVFVLVGEVPVEKEFVAALSCLLSGRISREAFLMETGLPQDTTWSCDDAGFFSIDGGACYPFAVFGEFNGEYGYQYRKRYEDITGNVIRILNGWDPAVWEEPVVEDIDDTIIDDVPVNETDPDDTGEEGGDSLVDFSDSNNDYFIV
ncbi:MAG: hypothetical protein IKN06_01815 [Bacteroidales bacterium]|nr:hypothetical protein [Bacteroidales bacterium]